MALDPIEVKFSVDVAPAVRALRQAALTTAEAMGGAAEAARLLREWQEQSA